MLKFGGQGGQVGQVDGSVDFSGFGSSCPRCSRCFNGASIQELEVRSRFTVLVSIDQYWSVVSELRGMGAGVAFLPGT